MDKLIRGQDLKSLLWGAAGVAVVGVMLGASMQPNLRAPGDIEGAQQQFGISAGRSAYTGDNAVSWASYRDGIPEYVTGTDWLKPEQETYEALPEYAYADDAAAYEIPAYEVASNLPVADAPAREPTRYPSVDGGVAYAAADTAGSAVANEPVETSLDPEMAELAAATPG